MPVAAITSLRRLNKAEAACTRCPLYAKATQVVSGEGPARARIMLVGEQPGDQEDKQGRPFVGPAGRVLDRAIAPARIERGEVRNASVRDAASVRAFTDRRQRTEAPPISENGG